MAFALATFSCLTYLSDTTYTIPSNSNAAQSHPHPHLAKRTQDWVLPKMAEQTASGTDNHRSAVPVATQGKLPLSQPHRYTNTKDRTQTTDPSSSISVESSYIDCLPSEWPVFGVNVIPDQCTQSSDLTERRHALCDILGTSRTTTSAHELLMLCVGCVKAYTKPLPERWQDAERWWQLPMSAPSSSFRMTAQGEELTKRWLDGHIDDSYEIIWDSSRSITDAKLRDLNQEAAGEEDLVARSKSAAFNLLRRADAHLKETEHGNSSNSRPHLVWCLQRPEQDANVSSPYLVPNSVTTED